MTANNGRVVDLTMRIQDAFLGAPRLALTLPAAQKRFGVDNVTCEAILTALVEANVLARMREGVYVRHFPQLARGLGDTSLSSQLASGPSPDGSRRLGRRAA